MQHSDLLKEFLHAIPALFSLQLVTRVRRASSPFFSYLTVRLFSAGIAREERQCRMPASPSQLFPRASPMAHHHIHAPIRLPDQHQLRRGEKHPRIHNAGDFQNFRFEFPRCRAIFQRCGAGAIER